MPPIRFGSLNGGRFTAGVFTGLALGVSALIAQPAGAPVATFVEGSPAAPLVTGSRTCSTSGCHGGADDKHNQVFVWSQRDVHARSYATLTTARSARMAEALRIPDPLTSARCTTCHAPAATVDAALLAPDVRVNEGVSCASCHGPDTGWLRSHTRSDFTHADRVSAGLRDLGSTFARANACVACHQTIDPELINVGKHPRLIFELDGQIAAQPRHWKEELGSDGGRAWLVGQAVALREVSHALVHGRADTVADTPRWQALVWLVRQAGATLDTDDTATPENFARVLGESDVLARARSDTSQAFDAPGTLARLAGAHVAFRDERTPRLLHALRAERLVLALDRLLHAAMPDAARKTAASRRLDALFARAQSVPDFAPAAFADELAEFEKSLR